MLWGFLYAALFTGYWEKYDYVSHIIDERIYSVIEDDVFSNMFTVFQSRLASIG